LVATAALSLAVVATIRLARRARCRAQLPVVAALSLALAINITRPILKPLAPLAVDRALYLVFPAMSAGLALEVLAVRWTRWAWLSRVLAVAGYVASVALLLKLDPPRRSPELDEYMLRVHLVSLAAQAVAAFVFFVRTHWRHRMRWRDVDAPEVAVLLLLVGDVAELFGPWLYGDLARDWDLARAQWAVVYCAIWYVYLGRLRRWHYPKATRAARGGLGSWPSGRRVPS